jgi:hypothetical protein
MSALGQKRTHAPQHNRRKKKDRLAAVSPKSEILIFLARRKRCARRPIIDDLMSFLSVTSPSAWAIAGVSNELIDVCTGLPFPAMTQR